VADARRIYEKELRGGAAAVPRGMFWLTRMLRRAAAAARASGHLRLEVPVPARKREQPPYAATSIVCGTRIGGCRAIVNRADLRLGVGACRPRSLISARAACWDRHGEVVTSFGQRRADSPGDS
jgi:hypothetical protein